MSVELRRWRRSLRRRSSAHARSGQHKSRQHRQRRRSRGQCRQLALCKERNFPVCICDVSQLPSHQSMRPVQFAGGHTDGIRQSHDGRIIFKRLQSGHKRDVQEVSFLLDGARECALERYVPRYYGLWWSVGQSYSCSTNSTELWVGIESAMHGFEAPCYLDIKLGGRIPPLSAERVARKLRRSRETSLHAHGVKVVAGTVVRHRKGNGLNAEAAVREKLGLKYGRDCQTYNHVLRELGCVVCLCACVLVCLCACVLVCLCVCVLSRMHLLSLCCCDCRFFVSR